ncbi:TPA: hypothetical protein DCW38_07170 [candidate division WOR-3 bacterium]|jgi:ABC-2 type transport system permease protein|uniref:ABC transporter permease n=1 Tax=candidate division WOR-3 bacterium TaxID=2052148 RepID=A0A350HBM4_UNCW3|nr:hypothetical protein [candidate division WOR-3 bacterium]
MEREKLKIYGFFSPGIMSSAVSFLTTLLTILAFVTERKSGVLERLLSTPLKEIEIVSGYAFVYEIFRLGYS